MRDFLRKAFSDGDQPSSSRVMSAICSIAVIAWGTHVVAHTHAMPDALALGAATAFAVSHYTAGKVTGIFTK
jgi:dolichyl-phosphate-mannose--protein O-mannosyl transferase